jgi:hypothetical protein
VYLQLLRHLCAFNDEALSFRVGGNSAEEMKKAPTADRWRQLRQIHAATRTPLILNLNLQRGDVELNRAMIRDAQEYLPAGAIGVFELGNEPEGWTGKHRTDEFRFPDYLQEFNRMGRNLVPALTPGLAGPAWAHGAPPEVLRGFIAAQPRLLKLLTVHSYRFDPARSHSIQTLLNDSNTAGFAVRFGPGVQVAHEAGLPLRLSEAGSAWHGGIPGFSDTFASALWTLDVMFEFARVGLDGVNFHNAGANPYSIIQEACDPLTGLPRVTANAPYYGMLLFAEATANHACLLPGGATTNTLKLWATLDRKGVVRVVIINKDLQADCDVVLEVPGRSGSLKRLTAPSPDATKGIRLAGQSYDDTPDGNPVGALVTEVARNDGRGFQVRIGPASAVLLTIPEAGRPGPSRKPGAGST